MDTARGGAWKAASEVWRSLLFDIVKLLVLGQARCTDLLRTPLLALSCLNGRYSHAYFTRGLPVVSTSD